MNNRYSLALLMVAGCLILAPVAKADSVVRMETVFGNIDLILQDHAAPGTVYNFITNYVDKGAYNNSVVYRVATTAVDGVSVIQGGGFVWDDALQQLARVPKPGRVRGEPLLSNERGSIAMALTGLVPDINSGSADWFINTTDNSAALDPSGFTVFGHVLGSGMTVVDTIAALPRLDTSTLPQSDTLALQAPLLPLGPTDTITSVLHAYFPEFPLSNYTSGPIDKPNLALISKVHVMARGPLGSIGTELSLPGDKYAILNISTSNYTVTVDSFAAAANPDTATAPAGVSFDHGIYGIKLGNAPSTPLAVVLGVPEDQPLTTANRIYKYGPTPDNPAPHWYDFMYDASTGTGAVVNGSMIMLVFVDGQRGDDDLTVNGTIGDANDVVAVGTGPAASGGGGGGGATDLYSLFALMLALAGTSRRRSMLKAATIC